MKTYTIKDAVESINKEISEANEKQFFRKAERLEKYKKWLIGGCIGRKPKV